MPKLRRQKTEDPKILFGKLVRHYRIRRGWSQMEFAFEAKLDRTYIGGVERGERNISLLNICKIAEALGLKPSDLMKF